MFRPRGEDLVWPVFLAATLIWSVQTGRDGIASNHFLPAAAAVSIQFGIAADRWRTWLVQRSRETAARAGSLLAAALLAALMLPLPQVAYLTPPTDNDKSVWKETIEFIRGAPGPVLIDYASSAAVAAGRWDHATDSCNLMYFRADPSPVLVPALRERRFTALVLYEHTFFPASILTAITDNYLLVNRLSVHTSEADMDRYLLWFVPKRGVHE
jgi:hypothetical protein